MLGTTTVDTGGSFQVALTNSALPGGNHTLVATEIVNGKATHATAPVDVEVIQ